MAKSIWRRWLHRLTGNHRSPPYRKAKRQARRTILQVEQLESREVPATITQWNFEGVPTGTDLSPTPSTGSGTATALGMTNSFNGTTSTNGSNIVKGANSDTGTNNVADTTDLWRIVGAATVSNPGNGWSSQAAIGTQGAEFAGSTVGFSTITVSFDWYATTQGEGKLQLEYTTNDTAATPTWINVAITVPGADNSPAGAIVAKTNSTSANTVMGSYVQINNTGGQDWAANLTATINDPNAANDPNFAIELVNASTGADCVNTKNAALNNTSGNWRFDNVTLSGTPLGISGLPTSVTDISGAAAVNLATSASFGSLLTSSQLNTSTLTVATTANGDTPDTFAITNQGSGAGQIGVSGSSVSYAGTTIGTFTGGTDGSALVVTFNSNSTAAAIQALINDITFQTTSNSTATRTVQFTFTPSTGNGSPENDSESVIVQKDTPTINPGTSITLGENAPTQNIPLSGINDGESDNNANVTSITASVTANSNASLIPSTPTVTNFSIAAGTATLSFSLGANQTGTATITVTVTNSFNNTATATFSVTVNAITLTTTPVGVFTGGTVAITSADLSATETGVTAANIQYTLTGNPPAADGTLFTSKSGSAVALAQNGTFTQADVNNGLITYVSSGNTNATDNIAFSVSDMTNGGSLTGQSLSVSVVAPPASPGNLAVMQLAAASNNTTGTVLYLNPTTTQTSPVQSIPITQMSFSDSGTSSFLSDTNDNSLLAFAAYPNPTGIAPGTDLATDTATNGRGVGTLDANGDFTLQTTYTESTSGDQSRSATSLDGTTWYITDKGGLFTNGATSPSLTTNILISRAFGGTIYIGSAKTASSVSTVSSPTATSLTPLPGLAAAEAGNNDGAGDLQDFYLIESGTNGNTYDVLYTLDQNATNATINKYSLVNGSWVLNGSAYTLAANATSMIAANNGSGGASLYVVTTLQAADNSVVLLTDTTGWNAPLTITAAPVSVYTATGTNTLKGIAFAPTDLPNFSVSASAPQAVTVGSQFNYTLTATNSGPANASNVEVQFTLPAGETFVSASGNDDFTFNNLNGGVVTLTGGTLNSGASATLTITVSATTAGVYTAPVGAAVIDPNNAVPEGREFIDNFNTSAVSTLVTNDADLTITNITGPSTAYTNQPIVYTLTAANEGTANATGDVKVQFSLPTDDSNLQYVSALGAGFTVNEANGVVTFSGGTLDAGATENLTVTVEDTATQLVDDGVVTTDTATVPAGAAVISTSDSIPEAINNQTSTSTVTTTISSPLEITGVDVSPVVGQSFTGVVATFSDATDPTDPNPADFSASIIWDNTQTSTGTVAFIGTQEQTDINGDIVAVSLYTVTGTNTYAATGTYPLSITIMDDNNNSATVNPTARVAYPPLFVQNVATIAAGQETSLTNQPVATFTDPGLVANLGTLGIGDPTTQFSASINWGDGPTQTTGTITYNAGTGVFSVAGSHTYAQAGSYSITVGVTPMTLSVERIDSSDPTNLNLVGDENGNGLSDSPSNDFIDQYVIGAANQSAPLYTTSLPDVATNGGNEALTNSSYSVSEGQLTLSTNGDYLVTGGYNDTVSAWAPQQTFSPASTINRVIGTINGNGVINTTTALTDAYSGDNFRGVASTDGTQFWTVGHASGFTPIDDFVHYATLGATTSTILTGPNDPSNINKVEIFNNQVYEAARNGGNSPNGIYQVGNGLPTSPTTQTLFIETQQASPLDVGAENKPMEPFDFFMADLNNGNPTINGVNVCYVADAQMGIARYDYYQAAGEKTPEWNFSYFIDSTGSFLDNAYTVSSVANQTGTEGDVSATANFNPNNPGASADLTKAGGVRGLTGVVVNGQVELFAVTGFGTGAQPTPGGNLIEVIDPVGLTVPSNGLNTTEGFTVLATNPTTDPSELTGVAFSPTATATSSAQIVESLAGQTSVKSAFAYNRFTRLWTMTVTITNTGSTAITGPLQVWLNNEAGPPATNATGTTTTGVSYVTVNPPGESLGAGQSVSITLTFATAGISFTPLVFGQNLGGSPGENALLGRT